MKIDYRKKCKACGKTGKANACILFTVRYYDNDERMVLRKVVTYRKGFILDS